MAIRRRRKTLTNFLSNMERRVNSVQLRPINLLTSGQVEAIVAGSEPIDGGPDTVVGPNAPNQYKRIIDGYYYSSLLTGAEPRVELYFSADTGLSKDKTIRISGVNQLDDSGTAVDFRVSNDYKTLSVDTPPWEDRESYNDTRHTPDGSVTNTALFNVDFGTEYSSRKQLIVSREISFSEATTTTAKLTFTSTNYFKAGDVVYVDMPSTSPYFGLDGLFRVLEAGSDYITYNFSSPLEEPINSTGVLGNRSVYAVARSATRDGATWINTSTDPDTIFAWKDIRWITYSTGDITKDTIAPSPITDLEATSENDTPDGNAIGLSRITLTWSAPQTSVDGSPIDDLIGYTIWWRQYASQEWSKADITGADRTFSRNGFEQGLPGYFRVFARDASGNLSTGVDIAHTTGRSDPQISRPTAPTVTTYLGTIKVAYDDTTANGNVQSGTAKEVQVYFSTVDNFDILDPVVAAETYYGKFAAGNNSFIIIPGTEPRIVDNTDYYFRINIRDIYGNVTQPSDQVSIRAKLSDIVTYDMIDVGTLRGEVIIGADIRTNDNPSTEGGIILNENQLIAYSPPGNVGGTASQTFRIDAATGAVFIGEYLGKEEAAGVYIAEELANETFATKVTAQAIELTANTANTNAINAQAAADTADDKAANALTRIEAGTITVTSEFRNRTISAINLNTEPGNTTTINGGSIKTGTVEAAAIKAGTLDAGVIYSGTISADKINTGTLNGTNVSITNLSAGNITSGVISSARINSDSISAAGINADNITAGTIASGRINTDSISAANVNASRITAGTLAGRDIRSTSSTTALRVEISGGTNEVRFMSGTSTTGYITGLTGSELLMVGSSGARVTGGASGTDLGDAVSGTTTIRGRLDITAPSNTTISHNFIGVDSSGIVRRHSTSFTSDARVKKDVKALPLGVDFLTKLNPVSYVLKADTTGQTKYGLIAQEVEKVLKSYGTDSSIVNTELDEKYAGLDSDNQDESYIRRIDYIQLIPILINSISELSDRISVLERERDQNNGN